MVGQINNTLSYAGIASQAIAGTIANELIIKYCFNTGSIDGASNQMGGIVGGFINNIGASGALNVAKGGKSKVIISKNCNMGSISGTSNASLGGIVSRNDTNAYGNGNNCFVDVVYFDNLNTGTILGKGTQNNIGSVIGNVNVSGDSVGTVYVSLSLTGNYNYSTDFSGGQKDRRAGVVGYFNGTNHSQVTLSNNYSAYKREDDSNTYGTNPATDGANVGDR